MFIHVQNFRNLWECEGQRAQGFEEAALGQQTGFNLQQQSGTLQICNTHSLTWGVGFGLGSPDTRNCRCGFSWEFTVAQRSGLQ